MWTKPDLGQQYTEKEFKDLEKKIRKVYSRAEKEIGEKAADFAKHHAKKDAKLRALVASGELSKEEYQGWLSGQVFIGKQWEARREEMAETLYRANDIAHRMAQGRMADVFMFNANFTHYELEKKARVDLGLRMYDSATVTNLIKNNPRILPSKKLNKEKDIRWNFKNIKSELTQGIIQGESIDSLTARLTKEMPNRNYKQARMHARTMMTSAQNQGRLESMKEHNRMGIETVKVWMATLDERTRWMHRDLDGQERPINEPFEVGEYTIMEPGDPDADPAMVYNCRCTMVEEPKKYRNTDYQRRDNTDQSVIENMTYNEWAEWKGVKNDRPKGIVPTKRGQ